jgi:transposase-like protein
MITEHEIKAFEAQVAADALKAFKDLLDTYKKQREVVANLESKLESFKESLQKHADDAHYRINWQSLVVTSYKKVGDCKRCKRTNIGLIDYSGHEHWVCEGCYDRLNDQFDDEYK